jgi:hypothetical protein
MRPNTVIRFQDQELTDPCTSRPIPKPIAATGAPSDYLSPSQATKIIPNDGRQPSPAAVVRWITQGAKSRNGGRIKLQAIRTPKGWLTTSAWISDFLTAVTQDKTGAKPVHLAHERAEAARARLAAKGF